MGPGPTCFLKHHQISENSLFGGLKGLATLETGSALLESFVFGIEATLLLVIVFCEIGEAGEEDLFSGALVFLKNILCDVHLHLLRLLGLHPGSFSPPPWRREFLSACFLVVHGSLSKFPHAWDQPPV